ncbi:hybrid sensor histidine kinase/response regulator [Paralimibaculum aggregatum]|nr:ATP-binding protein [Limibaculum sp. NKW23]
MRETERDTAGGTAMAVPEPASAGRETAVAGFDANGRLVERNAEWERLAGPSAPGADRAACLAAMIAAFAEIRDFPEADPARSAKIAACWAAPGEPVEARLPDGSWRLLASHDRADGGRSFLAIDITRQEETHALANRLLIENPVAIWAVEAATGRFAFANQAARALYGAARSEDQGLALIERFMMPHQRDIFDSRAAAPGRVDFVDALLETPSGKRLWTAGATKGIAHRGRALTMCTLFDTTESERADHEQARALEILNDAILNLDEALALYDADFRFVMGNARLYEQFYSEVAPPKPGEHSHETIRRLVEAGFYAIPEGMTQEAFLARTLAGVDPRPAETEIALADGRSFLRKIHTTRIGGYFVTFTETTAERRAERAEHEADRLVRTIVENSPTTFLVSRIADGKIIYFPPASQERFGDIESTLSFFLDPKDREDYLAALMETGSLTDYPVRFRRRDGSVMQGLTSARVVTYKGEDVIISSTRDITETLAMQAELERSREIAHQNEKLSALGELLAGVSHELNNPLSIIVGYALMLQDRIDDPALRRRVDRIAQAAERCTKIVHTFLAMARKRPARIEPCDLNEVIEMALDVAGYGLRTEGAEVICDLEPGLPHVAADPDQMAQVLTNLIVNAEHALAGKGPEGRLRLASFHDAEAGEVVVEIADNGHGISRDVQARIFEPFFTTKAVGTGTGVGLAFCHRIVTAHGGRLTVQSEPGRGATFAVALEAIAAPRPRAPAAGPAETHRAARRVLVVDDEPDVADMICDVLAEAGYETEACNRARSALARLAERRFDAILSDIRMPDLDGAGFLEALRRQAPDRVARLGFVTGDALSPPVQALLASSGRPHLEKPLMPEALIALADRLADPGRGDLP